VTVLEVIQRSTEFLAKKEVDSPRLQVELLLAHVLKMPRMKLYLNFDRTLQPAELDALREMVKRRGNREPLQHIVGSTSFCGLEIAVNRHVLIPRPETELLAERAWKFAATVTGSAPKVLDLCTGSGCLAIAVAENCAKAEIYATDISPEALAVARDNASRNNLSSRVQFFEGDCFAPLPEKIQFDLIVSNPPYIPSSEIETLQTEVRDHDPRLALDGGADGLEFYRKIAGEAKRFLSANAQIMLEFGDGQATAIRGIFETQGWNVLGVEQDFTGKERMLIAALSK
jgi:release factor glutamine methyltransferase